MKDLLIIFSPSLKSSPQSETIFLSKEHDGIARWFSREVTNLHQHAVQLGKDSCIYCDTPIQVKKVVSPDSCKKYVKIGADEGEEMFNAFLKAFIKEYTHIVLVRKVAEGISKEILEDAFHKLLTNDYVIGPSKDGEYYLIGMKKLDPFIFDIHTTREHIRFHDILEYTANASTTCYQLPVLNEIKEAIKIIN